jgi:hypothetical protein
MIANVYVCLVISRLHNNLGSILSANEPYDIVFPCKQ